MEWTIEKIMAELALCGAATREPWLAGVDGPASTCLPDGEVFRPDHIARPKGFRLVCNTDCDPAEPVDRPDAYPDGPTERYREMVANRDFIAHARTGYPAVLQLLLAQRCE